MRCVSRWDDEEDWVGEPPEGRYTADRAKPDYWKTVAIPTIAGVGVVIGLVILLIVLLT